MGAAYRADHVGSFLRPADLLEARRNAAADGEARLRAIEDQPYPARPRQAKRNGLRYFHRRRIAPPQFHERFHRRGRRLRSGRRRRAHLEGRRKRSRPSQQRHRHRHVKAARGAPAHRPRTSVPESKQSGRDQNDAAERHAIPRHLLQTRRHRQSLSKHSALLWDIVEIMKTEIARLSAEGVSYIQIDAPRYSYFMDPKWRDWIRTEMNADPDALLDESIRADNACFAAARRPGVTLAIHLCRGNNRSHWYAEGGYDAIAEKMFGTLGRRSLPARVRRRALRNVRAAAFRPPRQDSRSRAGKLQAAGDWKAATFSRVESMKPRNLCRSKISR